MSVFNVLNCANGNKSRITSHILPFHQLRKLRPIGSRKHLWICFLNHDLIGHEIRVTDIDSHGNLFKNDVAWFRGLGPKARLFFIHQPTTTVQQKPIMMSIWFFIFLKVCTDIVENGKRQVKINRLNYIAILSKLALSWFSV